MVEWILRLIRYKRRWFVSFEYLDENGTMSYGDVVLVVNAAMTEETVQALRVKLAEITIKETKRTSEPDPKKVHVVSMVRL